MPKGVYRRTNDHAQAIRLGKLSSGYRHPQQTCQKISFAMKKSKILKTKPTYNGKKG